MLARTEKAVLSCVVIPVTGSVTGCPAPDAGKTRSPGVARPAVKPEACWLTLTACLPWNARPAQPWQGQDRSVHDPEFACATYTAEPVVQPSRVPSADQARAGGG